MSPAHFASGEWVAVHTHSLGLSGPAMAKREEVVPMPGPGGRSKENPSAIKKGVGTRLFENSGDLGLNEGQRCSHRLINVACVHVPRALQAGLTLSSSSPGTEGRPSSQPAAAPQTGRGGKRQWDILSWLFLEGTASNDPGGEICLLTTEESPQAPSQHVAQFSSPRTPWA